MIFLPFISTSIFRYPCVDYLSSTYFYEFNLRLSSFTDYPLVLCMFLFSVQFMIIIGTFRVLDCVEKSFKIKQRIGEVG